MCFKQLKLWIFIIFQIKNRIIWSLKLILFLQLINPFLLQEFQEEILFQVRDRFLLYCLQADDLFHQEIAFLLFGDHG